MSGKLWKPYRLRKDWQFKEVIEKRQKVVNRSFVIYLIPASPEATNCQFGIAIPKSLVEEAAQRNLYKRQIRNMLIFNLRNHKVSCQINENHSHYELVIIIRPSYLENDFRTNQRNLYGLLFFAFRKKFANLLPEGLEEKNPKVS